MKRQMSQQGRENKKRKPVSDRSSPALQAILAFQEPDFAGSQRERRGKEKEEKEAWFHYMNYPGEGDLQKQKVGHQGWLVAGGWEWSVTACRYGDCFWGGESVLELHSGDVFTTP